MSQIGKYLESVVDDLRTAALNADMLIGAPRQGFWRAKTYSAEKQTAIPSDLPLQRLRGNLPLFCKSKCPEE